MKKTLSLIILLVSLSASADYSIMPLPKTGGGGGKVSIPHLPKTDGHNGSLHAYDQQKDLASAVDELLVLSEVNPGRYQRYKAGLLKVAQQDTEIFQWIYQTIAYFKSPEYLNQSPSQQNIDRFDTRLVINMIVGEED